MKHWYLIAGVVLVFGLFPGNAKGEHVGHAAMKTSDASHHPMAAKAVVSHDTPSDVVLDCVGDHCPACLRTDLLVDHTMPVDKTSPMNMCGSCVVERAPSPAGVLIASVKTTLESSSIPIFCYERLPDILPLQQKGPIAALQPILNSVLRL